MPLRADRLGQSHRCDIRTWYGIHGTVVIGPGFRHSAGLGGILLPHPPIVNWLLRHGLPEGAGLDLNVRHEISHLHTLPLAFLHAAALAALTILSDHAGGAGIILGAAGAFAGWELMSEALTALSDLESYRREYRGVTAFRRVLFWSLMAALASAPWYIMR